MNRPETTISRLRQRGALSVITPLLLLFVIILTVMALDGARLYSLRSEMQAQVNVAAQAAAGEAQTCGGQAPSSALVQMRALAAATTQGFQGDDEDLQVQLGVIEDADNDGVLAFAPVNFIEESNAVQVSYTRTEPISMLLPESVFGGIDLSVNAAVRKEVVATISTANSTLIAAQDNSVLGVILGNILGIPAVDATDLENLAGTTATVGELLEALNVDDVADLTSPVLTAEDLATALSEAGSLSVPIVSMLDAAVASGGLETVPLTDVLRVVQGASVPEDSEFPLYDTVIALVLKVAELAFTIPPTTIDIPGLPGQEVTLDLVVNQAPSVLVGTARWDASESDWIAKATGADIDLTLSLDVALPSIGPLSLGSINVPLMLSTGRSELALVAAECARGSSQSVAFIVDASVDGVALDGVIDARIAGNLLAVTAVVDAGLSSSDSGKLEFDVDLLEEGVPRTPANGYRIPQTLPNQGGVSLSLEQLDVKLLGVSLIPGLEGLVKGVVNSTLAPILDGLASGLLSPLLAGLGVNLGTVTASLDDARQGRISLLECSQQRCSYIEE